MSKKFNVVKTYYDKGFWNAEMVKLAVEKGWITQEECDEILSPKEIESVVVENE